MGSVVPEAKAAPQRSGNEVQTFDVKSGRLEVRPVTRVFRHQPRTVGQLPSRAGAGPRSSVA